MCLFLHLFFHRKDHKRNNGGHIGHHHGQLALDARSLQHVTKGLCKSEEQAGGDAAKRMGHAQARCRHSHKATSGSHILGEQGDLTDTQHDTAKATEEPGKYDHSDLNTLRFRTKALRGFLVDTNRKGTEPCNCFE